MLYYIYVILIVHLYLLSVENYHEWHIDIILLSKLEIYTK